MDGHPRIVVETASALASKFREANSPGLDDPDSKGSGQVHQPVRDSIVVSGSLKHDWAVIASLSLLWVSIIAFLGVHGDFSLNDDWAYSYSTKILHEEGRYERSIWTYTPVFTNIVIGALFSRIFGFSLEILRVSNVLMA